MVSLPRHKTMAAPRMTPTQRDVLLALNLRQMQMGDVGEWAGIFTSEVAAACGRTTRSVAVVLSQMREWRWVRSVHTSDKMGWELTEKGVKALEATRGV